MYTNNIIIKNNKKIRLIVNADDFGESPVVNAAIMQAFHEGILTSTSLMVTGEGFEQAVQLARANPKLRIGLHITLLEDRPCLPAEAIPDLVNAHGRFLPNPIAASKQWLTRPSVGKQIRHEVRAQMERFLETGLPLDHLNSHFHFHMHPQLFNAVLEVADEVGQPHIRLPKEALWPALGLDRSDLSRKLGYLLKFNLPSLLYRLRLKARGYHLIDGVLGMFQTGHINEQYLLQLLKKIPTGTYELYAHPRLDRADGLRELRALIAPKVRQLIQERHIHLTTYSQLIKDSK
jgi:hopanoid biosynthesis associated protein HpnK